MPVEPSRSAMSAATEVGSGSSPTSCSSNRLASASVGMSKAHAPRAGERQCFVSLHGENPDHVARRSLVCRARSRVRRTGQRVVCACEGGLALRRGDLINAVFNAESPMLLATRPCQDWHPPVLSGRSPVAFRLLAWHGHGRGGWLGCTWLWGLVDDGAKASSFVQEAKNACEGHRPECTINVAAAENLLPPSAP